MVDSIADTCTSLRHKMDLPLGFDEEDPPAVAAAKEEPAPQTDKGEDAKKVHLNSGQPLFICVTYCTQADILSRNPCHAHRPIFMTMTLCV